MRDVLTRPAPPPDRTVRYGPHPDQVIDLRFPAVQPAPLVVVIHGGFWRAEWDRAHSGPMAQALTEAGYVVAVPEYRRAGWPETFDDIATALDSVPGSEPVWVGHSAGGHLALWAASRHRLPPGSRWRPGVRPVGVVSLAGCCDLALCARLGLGDDAVADLMGGSLAELAERYAAADPAMLLPSGVPVTLVHGTEDDRVPLEVSRSYAMSAHAEGDEAEVRELPGIGHFELIDPLSEAWPEVLSAIASRVFLSPI